LLPFSALWLIIAGQAPEAVAAPPPPTPAASIEPAPATQIGGTQFHGAFELSAMTFPSDPSASSQDFYLVMTPLIGVNGGDDFSFELGAPLRLLVFDTPPDDHSVDYGHVLRKQDWDEASDFGQILRLLRIGADQSHFLVRAGPLADYTLGWGHLISRYDERLNPDYHPSGARAVAFLGPTRSELMVSDILGARLVAGEVALDIGRIFSSSPGVLDRFHIAGSGAYDFGRAGTPAPKLGLANIDLDAAVYRGPVARIFLEAGSGARVDVNNNASLSAVGGVSVDAQLEGPRLSGKLELRKQEGVFRPGMIGPGYELGRFADVGLYANPIATTALPSGFSAYAEFAVSAGSEAPGDSEVTASASAEHFSWGRTDADVAASTRLFGGHLVATARGIAAGMGVAPRFSGQVEVRWRFLASFYALGYAGTAHFVQPDGSLAGSFYAGGGAAVDFTR
jgi:hypothetical protein